MMLRGDMVALCAPQAGRSAGVGTGGRGGRGAMGYPPLLRLVWSCGRSEAEGVWALQRMGLISDLCLTIWDVAPCDAVRVLRAAEAAGLTVPAEWIAEAAETWRIPSGFRCACGGWSCKEATQGKDGHGVAERWAGVPSYTEWSEARALILGGVDNRAGATGGNYEGREGREAKARQDLRD